MLKVFVYGTLKPGESNYQSFCAEKIIEYKKAYTKGELFHLPLGYPAMTLGSSKVHGFLLFFDQESVLESLDLLEDYKATRSPEENLYYREKILTYNNDDQLLGEAWAYFMTSERVNKLGAIKEPSGFWTASA